MKTTINGSSCSRPLNPKAEKKTEKTFAYCLILVNWLLGNSFVAVIVYGTQTLRKPTNFFIVNMAMSDLVYPIFYIPTNLTGIYVGSSLTSGPLGQVVCKFKLLSIDCLQSCVYSEPGPYSSGSIWSCCISSPFSIHSSVQSGVPSSFSPRGS